MAVKVEEHPAGLLKVPVAFPAKLDLLLGCKSRYKILYGGRGGAKSWAIARALILRAVTEPGGLRVLCTREVQSSMKESVHQLLKDQIAELGLGAYFRVLDDVIRGPNGSLFTFKGLRDPEALKSTEGIDVCWIEEARTLTAGSWKSLDPTIRKPGSEIWISFNPKLEIDFVYDFFVKKEPPPGSMVVKVNWYDNPWFPDVLRAQMEHSRDTDYDSYLHIWEGFCEVALEGAVYANELRAATKDRRICRVPFDPTRPVYTFWDLGRGDLTAIWFVQIVGMEYRVIRYYQNNGHHISHFIQYLQRMESEHGYTFGTVWLPHDADNELLASKRTIRQQVSDANFKVRIVPKISVADGINTARTIMPQCWFHEIDAGDGISALRAYHYDVRADGLSRSKNPVHDWCLTPDTEVLTRNGSSRIDQLTDQGEVLTPWGWKPYHSPRMTRKNAPLVEVRFVGGHTVRCTPEHSFLTDSGWKYAEHLTPDSVIQSFSTTSRSTGTAASTVFGRARDTLRAAVKHCIERYGRRHSETFQRAVTSTIETETTPTADLITSNVCQPVNIYRSPGQSMEPSENSTSPTLHESALLHGTDQRKESSGIVGTQSEPKAGRSGSDAPCLADIAALSFLLSSAKAETPRNTAPTPARLLRIESVERLPYAADVWCLTVPGFECFSLANGAVVHNSSNGADGFRYMGVALMDIAPKKKTPRAANMERPGPRAWMSH